MKVYASVEIRNGTRLRDDGSYMTNADRGGRQQHPINDSIWFAEPGQPKEWDRRHMGQFCIDCATQAEREKVMMEACPREGVTTLRIVWDRTPFSDQEKATIQRRIPDDEDIPPIPTMTYDEFKAATLPENSKHVLDEAVATVEVLTRRILIGEELLAGAALRDRPKIQVKIERDTSERNFYESLRIEFSKRLAREEDLPRRTEVTRG